MPRVLSDDPNELAIQDHLSNSKVVFYYEMPDAETRIGYENEVMKRQGGVLVTNKAEAHVKYGLKILKGVREGDLVAPKEGKMVPLSSDRTSKHFNPAWKSLVRKYAADLVEVLAIRVFDISATTAPAEPQPEPKPEPEDEGTDGAAEEQPDPDDPEGN